MLSYLMLSLFKNIFFHLKLLNPFYRFQIYFKVFHMNIHLYVLIKNF